MFPVGGIVDPPTGGSASGSRPPTMPASPARSRSSSAARAPSSRSHHSPRRPALPASSSTTSEHARASESDLHRQPARPPATIAAVISSYTLGDELLQAYKQNLNPTIDFKVFGTFTDRFLHSDRGTSGGDPDHVVVVGDLDWVPNGPGIDDDGSGTATLLPRPRRSPTAATRSGTRSASRGGVRKKTSSSARPTSRNLSQTKWTRST